MTDFISPDFKRIDTLPERLALARQQKVPHQRLLFTLLSDE